MIVYLLQMFISVLALVRYRSHKIRYLAVVTAAYFLAYLEAGSYDVPLSLYFLLILAGIGIPIRIRTGDLLMGILIAVYAGAGIFFQDMFTTMTALITRYGYILIFIVMISEKRREAAWNADVSDYRFLVRLGLVTEILIIAQIWLKDGLGARVVHNHQPIGAGIVIGLSIIIGWCYVKKMFSDTETLVYSIVSILIVLLSGTRGYMVIMALPMAAVVLMYLLDIPGNGRKMLVRIGWCFLIAALAAGWMLLIDHGETLIGLLRLDDGLGYRENENAFVKEIMLRAPWYNQLFGFGLGGNASHVEGFLTAAGKASWNRSFMYYKLLTRTFFHNYWYTVLFKQGIIGIIAMAGFYLRIFRQILQIEGRVWERILLVMMAVGNVVSLTFRITATCSVFEVFLIAFFIRQLENERQAVQEQNDTREGLQKGRKFQ